MSVRTKVGLGFTDCISQKELGWDDSAFSVFTTTSEDMEGRPTFHRFAKTDSMKAVPPPLTEDYNSLSDHSNLDESQMSYRTKSSTSNNYESVTSDFVFCHDSDKSSEDNTSDFACGSSGNSLEHKPIEIESNVGTPITEPISLKDLLSFTCDSSEKTDHTSRTSFTTSQPKVKPVPTGKPKVKPVPTGQPKVKPVPTGRAKVNSVLTAKPK
nr:hypothetical protein [Tanacetum cinerariifolium]